MRTELCKLEARMAHLEQDYHQKMACLEQECRTANARHRDAARRFRLSLGLAMGVVCLTLLLSPGKRAAIAQGNGSGLEQRVSALESKVSALQSSVSALQSSVASLQQALTNETSRAEAAEAQLRNEITSNPVSPFTVNGTDVTLSGYNLHIVNGQGSGQTNGLGNLIIGYNQFRNDGSDVRIGSDNLVVGDFNNYSSNGGFVVGDFNSISAPYASVSGGYSNTASGLASSVSGGNRNTASSLASSVSGGISNTASFLFASVSGGAINTASSYASSVSGGSSVSASLDYQWVGGSYHSP